MIEFRPYQYRAIQSARDNIAKGIKRNLIYAPTGAGKTVIAAGIVQLAVSKGKRVLFLAHRRELIMQCCDKLVDGGVLNFGVIMAGNRLNHAAAPVQVASIQTLIRRELPEADLIIIDECHRANSKSYLSILVNYPKATVLGLTATPERMDGKGLDDIFDEMITVETVPTLIDLGFLIKPVCYVGPTADMSGVKIRRGDYDEQQLSEAMDKPQLVGDIIENWMRLAKGRRTAVFASGVEHAKHIAQEFFNAGVPSAVVTGETPLAEREAIISDWRAGIIQVVANVFVFIEGFDLPELECCIMARPTKSISLYLQAAGRIMRPAPGKPGALLLDHAGCCVAHGQPHIHREWTLEGMAKKRTKDEVADNLAICGVCQMAFEAEPTLWLSETQPNILPDFAKHAQKVLKDKKAARALAVCPGCHGATCKVCNTNFHVKNNKQDIDGIGWEMTAVCVSCHSTYSDQIAHIEEDPTEIVLPGTTDDHLELMGDMVPEKVLIMNEYKRLINIAKAKGFKRGWAYWQMRAKHDEDKLKQCLPKHTGGWWKKQA